MPLPCICTTAQLSTYFEYNYIQLYIHNVYNSIYNYTQLYINDEYNYIHNYIQLYINNVCNSIF